MPGELSPQDQAMADKMDQVTAAAATAAGGQPAIPTRPDNIPEKFWDAEKGAVKSDDLLKSYLELEAKASKPAEEPKPEGEKAPEGEKTEAEKVVEQAGLDMSKLHAEFAEKGALSEDSIKALEKVGINKQLVDAYIAGQQALEAQQYAAAYSLVGGEDQFKVMSEWAAKSLSAAEVEAFNTAVTGTQEQMQQALLGLKARYEGAFGRDPSLLAGRQSGSESETAFASSGEMQAAIRDPRYKTDSAYRAMVERRIGLMPD